MKKISFMQAMSAFVLMAIAVCVIGGNLNPDNLPAPSMRTLDELYKNFERFAPKVFHTHCKNIRYPEDKKNVRRPMGWEYDKYACPI